jgi:outer membrane protein assembly factor BamD
MMRLEVRWLFMSSAAALLFASCASRGPSYLTMTPDELFEAGQDAHESRSWDNTIRPLERMTVVAPGDPRIEEARYLVADAYFNKREYVTAATEFTRLATDYPGGQLSERARFRACEAYYELSPRAELDQQYTHAAINHCQALVGAYPGGEYAERAHRLMAELREKLAQKDLINAEFYFRRRAYDSAILGYEELVERHPNSAAVPAALLRLIEAYDRIGYDEEAHVTRERLLREYPESAEAEKAQEIPLANGR